MLFFFPVVQQEDSLLSSGKDAKFPPKSYWDRYHKILALLGLSGTRFNIQPFSPEKNGKFEVFLKRKGKTGGMTL